MGIDAKEDKYLLGEINGEVFIKIVGNATMKNSKTLENVFNKLFEGEKKEIILDFAECNYMDSTMLGLLAKTAIKIKKTWEKTMFAINLSNIISTSLKSTGVDKLLNILDSKDVRTVAVEEIKTDDFKNKEEKTRHILESHKTLMDLSEENKAAFKNVVNLLEKELDK